jgi:hypothetical protein
MNSSDPAVLNALVDWVPELDMTTIAANTSKTGVPVIGITHVDKEQKLPPLEHVAVITVVALAAADKQ